MKKLALILLSLVFVGCNSNVSDGTNNDLDYNSAIYKVGQTSVNALGIYSLEKGNTDESSIIYFTDINSKDKIALCNNVSCTHSDDTCTAYIKDPIATIFTDIEDRYIFTIQQENNAGDVYSKICRKDINGENHRDLFTLKSNQSFQIPNTFVQIGDMLYFGLDELDKELNFKSQIYALNIITGESKLLMSFDKSVYLVSERNNELILKEPANLIPLNGSQVDYDTKFYKFNTENGTFNEFYRDSFDINNKYERLSQFIINENNIYKISNKDKLVITKIDIDTLEESKIPLNKTLTSEYSFDPVIVFDDYIIIDYIEGKESKRIAVNISTGDISDLTLLITGEDKRKAFIYPHFVMGDKIYVSHNSRLSTVKVTMSDGNMSDVNVTMLDRSFITKEDYLSNTPNYINFNN